MRRRPPALAANRGLLLDLVVFALNLVLVRMLGARLVGLVRGASGGDPRAAWWLAAFFAALLVLPAAGAVLRRWHFHRRRGARAVDASGALFGCLLNPVFYFVVSVTIASAAGALVTERVFGEDARDRAGVFLPMLFGVIVLSAVQTWLVYRYLTPPRKPPRSAFGRGPASELLGDACIFVNAIFFQLLWNAAVAGRFTRPAGVEDALGRLFFLWFVAILVYFPPRLFYLAEDAGRRSWATMLLATSPVVLHVFGIL